MRISIQLIRGTFLSYRGLFARLILPESTRVTLKPEDYNNPFRDTFNPESCLVLPLLQPSVFCASLRHI